MRVTAIKDEMIAILNTSVLKPMYKEFNALTKLESSRFSSLETRVCQSIRKHVRVKVSKINGPLRQLESKVDKTSKDVTKLVRILSRVVKLLDTSTPEVRDNAKRENDSRTQPKNNTNDDIQIPETSAPAQGEPKSADASNGQNSLALKLRRLTHAQLKAQEQELSEIEAERIQHINKMRDEYMYCIYFRDDPLPITKFNYRVCKSTKIANRNNQPLNYQIFDNFKLKMLGFAEWLELHRLASKRQNATNDQLLKNLKKIRVEVMKEVFLKEDIMINMMHRNLTVPDGVIRKAGLVIKEPKVGIFLYNGCFDMVFQRRSEYHLASATQLIKIQNLIKIDSENTQDVYDELINEIESKHGFIEARNIVSKNLDGLDQTRGLKVNIAKSRIIGVGVPQNKVEDMSTAIGCIHDSLPFSYLGLPVEKRLSTWCDIIKAVADIGKIDNSFNCSFTLKVSNGLDTRFWSDPWGGNDSRLMDRFLRLYALKNNKECKVVEHWTLCNGVWGGNWSTSVCGGPLLIAFLLAQTSLNMVSPYPLPPTLYVITLRKTWIIVSSVVLVLYQFGEKSEVGGTWINLSCFPRLLFLTSLQRRNKIVNSQPESVSKLIEEDIFHFIQRTSKTWMSAHLKAKDAKWSSWISRPFHLFCNL
ncbi:hypothetical protein Tco_1393579 [Tanacetum coccineum]